MKQCRKPEIMGDAAYYILTSPATECTVRAAVPSIQLLLSQCRCLTNSMKGNFFVDEKVLHAVGVTNLDHYAYVPGTKDFWPDFFVEERDGTVSPQEKRQCQADRSDGCGL